MMKTLSAETYMFMDVGTVLGTFSTGWDAYKNLTNLVTVAHSPLLARPLNTLCA